MLLSQSKIILIIQQIKQDYNNVINQTIISIVKTILTNQKIVGKKRLNNIHIAAILIIVLIIKFYLFFFHVLKQDLHIHLI